jgi:hypothetical protein
MSEHDANNALTATARMRALAEPVEDGTPMTFSERQYRAREARELRQVWLNVDWVNARIQRELADLLGIQTATGAGLDTLAGIPQRPAGMTDAELRAQFHGRLPDFRDGRCVHGESHFTCSICGVQMGRRDGYGDDTQ